MACWGGTDKSGAMTTPAVAAKPLLVNGAFNERTANGAPLGWRLSPGVTVETEGGHSVLVLRSTAPGGASAGQDLPCDPAWGVLRFRYRVSVPMIVPGKEGWHDARLALTFKNASGKALSQRAAGAWSKPTAGWLAVDQLEEVPEGTAHVSVAPAIFAATGELRIVDLKVEVAARRGQGIDAPIPAGGLQWGAEPIEKQSSQRDVICLNGLWRFMPALGPAASVPLKTGWGLLRVPGSWRHGPLPAPVRGTGPCWQGFNNETPAAWYERTLSIPVTWAGRAVILDMRRVSTDAVVFIDGREVGKVSWPGGEVNLSAAVKPGQTHSLRVKVVAVADQAEVTRFMGTGEGQLLKEKMTLATRGIVGDVLLLSRPSGAYLTGCAIQTKVKAPSISEKTPARGDTFKVVAEYTGLPTTTEVTMTAIVRHASTGAEARRFTANMQATAGDGSVSASWKWPDPMLWDIQKPNLYTLELALQGTGIHDALRETFGFREFSVEGKRFLLNGAEVRLRPAPVHAEGSIGGVSELIGDALDGLRWAGFNTHELWPWNRDERGTWEFDDLWCQEADRRGFLLIVPALDYPSGLSDAWNNRTTGPAWAKRMAPLLKRLRNHPSAVMWVTGTNRFGHGQDQNPDAIGSSTRGWLKHDGWRYNAEGGRKAIQWIKAIDPTRPVFMHAGGPVGDIYTSNNYLCLNPLQEREEWLSRWAADGDMPVMMVEFGTPLFTSFHRGRRGYAQAAASEPLYTEFCAIYQGAAAYRLESPSYRETLASTFVSNMLWSTWHSVDVPSIHEGFNQLQALYQQNTWRAWRTWGITGGMLPWSNGHGWLRHEGSSSAPSRPAVDALQPFKPGQRGAWKSEAPRGLTRYFQPEGMPTTVAGKALIAANQDTLAWIAGAPDFVDKSHHFRAGTSLRKQAALINDAREPAQWELAWQAEVDGVQIAEGTARGTLNPVSSAFVPISVSLPSRLKRDRVPGLLRLTCTIGRMTHTDHFVFTTFASTPVPAASNTIALLDPVGDTAALLRGLGLAATVWDGKPTAKLVVLGRNACAKGGVDPSLLAPHLARGGRVLMMSQDPAWLRDRLGLRVARPLARRAFPVIPDHPALAGLDAEAFRDWAGESRLVSPIDAPNDTANTPSHGWRWGAHHVVCSAPIEIPHRAGWRPILACEFDGAYTPLTELSLGGGVVTLCTLDVEDHAAADPAAERIARAVIAAAASARPEARAITTYLGSDAGAVRLDECGIAWQRTDARLWPAKGLDRLKTANTLPWLGVAVIGPEAAVTDAELDAFLRRGGHALILPRTTAEAPLGVRLKRVPRHAGSLDVPPWPSCRGLWPGELRRRTDGEAWVIASGADAIGADGLLAEVRRGKGVAVYCQFDTAAFAADRLTYNRYTRWRWTRLLSQLASNLGGVCMGDSRLILPTGTPAALALSGTWKARLTMPLPQTRVQDPHPADKGPSPAALALIARDADETGMQEVPVSRQWRDYGGAWAKADGEALFRRTIEIPAAWAGKDLSLSLGIVEDFDTAYFDGIVVGNTTSANPKIWTSGRLYTVPGRLVTAGRHVLAVRIFDHFNGGGLTGKSNELWLAPKQKPASAHASLYHADLLIDFPQGDDPYRYYRW